MKNVLLLSLAALLAACGGSGKSDAPRKNVPASKGAPCELLVVADPELHQGEVFDSILALTEGPTPGLGSNEPIFSTTTIRPQGLLPALSTMHSRLTLRLNPRLQRPRTQVAYDAKARPQILVLVEAPDAESMMRWVSAQRAPIQQTILDFQAQRLTAFLRKGHSQRVSKDLAEVAHRTIHAPTEMIATKRAKDFLWGSTNRNMQDLNMLYYSYPWDGEAFDVELFAAKRDSVLKANVPGAKPTQWMATTRGLEDVPVVLARPFDRRGRMATEVKGLWEMHGGFLGGPFVGHVMVDSVARRVEVVEGFVYNPQGKKRDLMRQLEAMCWSFSGS